MITKIEAIFLVVLLGLSLFLRHDKINIWPRLGATFDEYAWTWQGMNLIEHHVPISWSPHPQYKTYYLTTYQGAHFRIVKPFLEHPPVFGLIAGGFAIANGVHDMFDLDISKIRGLSLLLGLFSVFSLYALVRQLYDQKTAAVSAFLYATIPTIVIGSRIVQNENFFIPCFLISLFLLQRFLKTGKSRYRNIAALICGILILAKIPWAAAGAASIGILLYEKRYKDILKFLAIVIPVGLLFFAYGFYYDRSLFLSLWGLQLNRYDITFNSIFALFQKPYLVDRFYTDGWIYFGWFALILLLIKDFRKNVFVIIPILTYFVIFLAGIPDEPSHGWYRYPFYPFLIISIALFIKDYFMKNWPLTFFFLVFVGSSLLQLTWAAVFGFSFIIFRLSIIGWLLTLLPVFFKDKKALKLSRASALLFFASFVLMNIWAVLLYNEQ